MVETAHIECIRASSDLLGRKKNIGSTIEPVSLVIRQTVGNTTAIKDNLRMAFKKISPIKFIFGIFENKLTGSMAPVETTRENGGKEKVVIFSGECKFVKAT